MGTARRAADGPLESRPSADSGPSSLSAGDHRLDLRPAVEAVLVVPAGALRPLPLLVFPHGAGGSAAHSLTLMTAAALSLGLANGDLVDTVLAFSPGFAAPPARPGRPRVWISHGTGDRVLPGARCGRRVSRDLTSAGYDAVHEEFAGGHEVPPRLRDQALHTWLR